MIRSWEKSPDHGLNQWFIPAGECRIFSIWMIRSLKWSPDRTIQAEKQLWKGAKRRNETDLIREYNKHHLKRTFTRVRRREVNVHRLDEMKLCTFCARSTVERVCTGDIWQGGPGMVFSAHTLHTATLHNWNRWHETRSTALELVWRWQQKWKKSYKNTNRLWRLSQGVCNGSWQRTL